MPAPIYIPLVNPNEPEALLAALYVREGQRVGPGEPLGSLETTKSTQDFESPGSGYIAGLNLQAGQTVRAGDLLCYLAEDADWKPPVDETPAHNQSPAPEGLRISEKALAFARTHNVDLTALPVDRFVTEADIQALLKLSDSGFAPPQPAFDASRILIYGAGGHAKMVIDVLRGMHAYTIYGIINDGRSRGDLILGIPVIGGKAALKDIYSEGIRLAVNAVGGIGNIQVRINVFRILADAGFSFPVIAHPSAHIDSSAALAQGVQVFTHSYIGSEASLGFGVIANTGTIISHDCKIGDFTNISPGAVLAGNVTTGPGVLIGMGVTINLGVKIGAGAKIGNSAVVKADVPESGIVRAGTIWPEH